MAYYSAFLPTMYENSDCFISLAVFDIYKFLISYYSRFVVYLSFLVCISLMTDYVEHLFVYLFAIPIILLCEVSVKIFCSFYCVCFIMIAM